MKECFIYHNFLPPTVQQKIKTALIRESHPAFFTSEQDLYETVGTTIFGTPTDQERKAIISLALTMTGWKNPKEHIMRVGEQLMLPNFKEYQLK